MKRQKSILILEDEIELGELIAKLLEPIFVEVTYCESSEKALEHIKHKSYSLILTDVMMSGLPGHEFVKLIRSMGRIEPVIFITGVATKEVLLMALRLGASDVVEKPFETAELLQAIDRTLEIEKRQYRLYENIFLSECNEKQFKDQKKMIGLLQIASTKKSK